MAISAAYLFRAIGQVVGVGISASIQQSVLYSQLASRLHGDKDLVWEIIQEPMAFLPRLSPLVREDVKVAYLRSVQGVFGFVAMTGFCLSAVCLCIRAKRI